MKLVALLALAAGALLPGGALAATPAAAACVAAYERAQERRFAGDLIEARVAALDCSAAVCQPFVRKDCRAWQGELQNAIPSVRIEVENAPASAPVHLLVDGKPISSDDALLLLLNPGRHELAAIAGAQRVTKDVELAISEKARAVELSFPVVQDPQPVAPKTPLPAPAPAPAKVDVKPANEAGARRGRALPIALGVVGVAGLAGFGIFGAMARSQREQLPRCWPGCSPDRIRRINNLYLASDASLGIALASLGLATGILIFCGEPTASGRSAHSIKSFRLALAPSNTGVHMELSGQF
jgi:hypothetical protein